MPYAGLVQSGIRGGGICAVLALFFMVSGALASSSPEMPDVPIPHDCIADYSINEQGGWDYSRWKRLASDIGETLVKSVTDRYGDRSTPLWVAGLDPQTGSLIEQKPPNWQTYWEAEDYVMTVQGCNLQRDLPMLTALTRLALPACTDAVQQYLTFWLRECPGPKTGLFPWGEHMSYNCVRDTLIAERHELEYNPPDWELLWRINPEAVRREIEAIHAIHIWDKEKGFYDRHGNYYTGEFDPKPVRGTYIKHSGLYAHAFMFLYTKTKQPEHLEWARQMADLYWRYRVPETNLVYGYVSDSGGHEISTASLFLAYYLLESVKLHDDPYVRERALGIVDAFLKYGYNAQTGQFAAQLDPPTGAASGWGALPWNQGDSAGFIAAYAIWDAYEITRDRHYLEVLETRLTQVAQKASLFDEEGQPLAITPGAAGEWLQLYVKAFHATGNKQYLQWARGLAVWTASCLVKNNYILEAANGYVYLNYGRPGDLLIGWLDLFEAEEAFPVHWRAEPARPGETLSVQVASKNNNPVTINGKYACTSFENPVLIPVPPDAPQGMMSLTVTDTATTKGLDAGTVLIAHNPHGPTIRAINYPAYADGGSAFEGNVTVTDPSGVVEVCCRYTLPDGVSQRIVCTPDDPEKGRYRFSIPAISGKGTLRFSIVAQGNPAFPITSFSKEYRVPVAETKPLRFASGSLVARTDGITVTLRKPVSGDSTIRVHWVPGDGVLPQEKEKNNTSPQLLSGHIVWDPDQLLQKEGSANVCLTYDPEKIQDLLEETLDVYQRNEKGAVQPLHARRIASNCLEFSASLRRPAQWVLGGISRLGWRRTFNGALLTSPAVARVDSKGTLAIILTTGGPDSLVYAIDYHGNTVWKYDAKGAQPFPVVADLDGDGLDETAIGGNALVVLDAKGSERWKADLPQSNTPAIGDIAGDVAPEIVAATKSGSVAAYSSNGTPLWQTQIGAGLTIPALAHFEKGKCAVVIGGKNEAVALNGDGSERWRVPLEGETRLAPALGDLNHDGLDEAIFFARSDTRGVLTVVDGTGHVLWTAEVSRESDWSPVIAAMDAPGVPELLVQLKDPKKIGVLDGAGRLVRTLDTTGRLLQSPVPVDLNGDGKLDLLTAHDLSYRLWAIGNDGTPLWFYTPHSFTLAGAKIKMGGSLLVADLDKDEKLEVVGGDDETWLNLVRTSTPCARGAIISGQYHGDSAHRGNYLR